jgi:hypothetical protein
MRGGSELGGDDDRADGWTKLGGGEMDRWATNSTAVARRNDLPVVPHVHAHKEALHRCQLGEKQLVRPRPRC